MDASKAGTSKTGLSTRLGRPCAAVVSKARADTTAIVAVQRRLRISSRGRRSMFKRSLLLRHPIVVWLAIQAATLAIWETTLAIAAVLVHVVGVELSIVWLVVELVPMLLLLLLMLTGEALRVARSRWLLALSSWVGRGVTAVRVLSNGGPESGLISALGILAGQITLRGAVSAEASPCSETAVLWSLARLLLLAVVLPIIIVWVAILLISSVEGGILVGRGAVSTSGLLVLGLRLLLTWEALELGLGRRWVGLAVRVEWFRRERRLLLLGSWLTETTVLLLCGRLNRRLGDRGWRVKGCQHCAPKGSDRWIWRKGDGFTTLDGRTLVGRRRGRGSWGA